MTAWARFQGELMRAYYTADRAQFFADTDEHILGALAKGRAV